MSVVWEHPVHYEGLSQSVRIREGLNLVTETMRMAVCDLLSWGVSGSLINVPSMSSSACSCVPNVTLGPDTDVSAAMAYCRVMSFNNSLVAEICSLGTLGFLCW